jgi:hypothetical protein
MKRTKQESTKASRVYPQNSLCDSPVASHHPRFTTATSNWDPGSYMQHMPGAGGTESAE